MNSISTRWPQRWGAHAPRVAGRAPSHDYAIRRGHGGGKNWRIAAVGYPSSSGMKLAKIVLSLIVFGLNLAAARAGNMNAHVLVITIDGFPAYEFADPSLNVPTLRKLAEEGATAKG